MCIHIYVYACHQYAGIVSAALAVVAAGTFTAALLPFGPGLTSLHYCRAAPRRISLCVGLDPRAALEPELRGLRQLCLDVLLEGAHLGYWVALLV